MPVVTIDYFTDLANACNIEHDKIPPKNEVEVAQHIVSQFNSTVGVVQLVLVFYNSKDSRVSSESRKTYGLLECHPGCFQHTLAKYPSVEDISAPKNDINFNTSHETMEVLDYLIDMTETILCSANTAQKMPYNPKNAHNFQFKDHNTHQSDMLKIYNAQINTILPKVVRKNEYYNAVKTALADYNNIVANSAKYILHGTT